MSDQNVINSFSKPIQIVSIQSDAFLQFQQAQSETRKAITMAFAVPPSILGFKSDDKRSERTITI
ncbi:MAG TPA: hypothetical protein DD990_09560 [Cyanobacteria bacterium UBA11368]|nr:hypothetical protein [Cyanobacteria bacterium UBA11368]